MAISTSYSTPVNGTTAIWTLINLLVANGWTIPAWSDGTLLTTPGSPLVLNPYIGNAGNGSNGAGSGTASLGNVNAWFRIKAPLEAGFSREWLFQRGATLATSDYTWTVARSRNGATGGTAAVMAGDAVSGLAIFPAAQLFDATLSSRLLISVNPGNGAWSLKTIVSGGGNVRTLIVDEVLAAGTFPAADADPCLSSVYYGATGISAPYNVPALLWTAYKRIKHGLTGAANLSATLGIIVNPTGSVIVAPSTSGTTGQIGPEPYATTEVPIQIPVFRPYVVSTLNGWIGFTSGLRLGTVYGRANGQTLTDGINSWVYVGGVWFPWDSSTPTI